MVIRLSEQGREVRKVAYHDPSPELFFSQVRQDMLNKDVACSRCRIAGDSGLVGRRKGLAAVGPVEVEVGLLGCHGLLRLRVGSRVDWQLTSRVVESVVRRGGPKRRGILQVAFERKLRHRRTEVA